MIRATKDTAFSISVGLVNADNSMGTGKTVNYEIRLHSNDSLKASGTMTESVNKAGLYYVNPNIDTADFYRVYISSSGYPSVTEDIMVTEEETKINSIQTDLTRVKQIESGRWKIINNQMIFYDSDGVTPILTFDLKDENGNPIEAFPKERVPV